MAAVRYFYGRWYINVPQLRFTSPTILHTMNQNTLLVAALWLASCTALWAQDADRAIFETYDGGGDRCYGRVLIMPVFDTIEERIILQPAYSYTKTIPPTYKTETERVLVVPAHTRYEVIPAVFEEETEQILIKENSAYVDNSAQITAEELFIDSTQRVTLAPTYQTWKQVKRKDCRSRKPEDCLEWKMVEVPSDVLVVNTKNRANKEFEARAAYTITSPAEYATLTRKRLVKPATVNEVNVPAQYQTITKKVLVSPQREERVQVPAVYKTVQRVILIKPGGYMEPREVICREDYPKFTRKVQTALKTLGYFEEEVDGVFGKETRRALVRYQTDLRLPIGQYNYDTLEALGVL